MIGEISSSEHKIQRDIRALLENHKSSIRSIKNMEVVICRNHNIEYNSKYIKKVGFNCQLNKNYIKEGNIKENLELKCKQNIPQRFIEKERK